MSKFLQQVREKTRAIGLVDATEQVYTSWIKRYILFHKFQTEVEVGRAPRQDIEAFISHLANEQKLSASSINQAISALIFLYKEVHCNHFGQSIMVNGIWGAILKWSW